MHIYTNIYSIHITTYKKNLLNKTGGLQVKERRKQAKL